jgi:hypothetical protein
VPPRRVERRSRTRLRAAGVVTGKDITSLDTESQIL